MARAVSKISHQYCSMKSIGWMGARFVPSEVWMVKKRDDAGVGSCHLGCATTRCKTAQSTNKVVTMAEHDRWFSPGHITGGGARGTGWENLSRMEIGLQETLVDGRRLELPTSALRT
jgi:hypothetical protein